MIVSKCVFIKNLKMSKFVLDSFTSDYYQALEANHGRKGKDGNEQRKKTM